MYSIALDDLRRMSYQELRARVRNGTPLPSPASSARPTTASAVGPDVDVGGVDEAVSVLADSEAGEVGGSGADLGRAASESEGVATRATAPDAALHEGVLGPEMPVAASALGVEQPDSSVLGRVSASVEDFQVLGPDATLDSADVVEDVPVRHGTDDQGVDGAVGTSAASVEEDGAVSGSVGRSDPEPAVSVPLDHLVPEAAGKTVVEDRERASCHARHDTQDKRGA